MTKPRPLQTREQDLIAFYSHCQLGMTPKNFYAKWDVNQEALAQICSRSLSTVRRWFSKGRHYRSPMPSDLRHLALMDFLLEHFDDIPQELLKQLCFFERGK
ncbi:helix-turn-helix domain-containing protein [Scytonema sp. PCC 10023]|uniref:helix-turn-helix domain-containing protein n=1 Tax=Scytonema sp. PCC 10023 TaxID=1680591 RepID=UPI0039C6F51D